MSVPRIYRDRQKEFCTNEWNHGRGPRELLENRFSSPSQRLYEPAADSPEIIFPFVFSLPAGRQVRLEGVPPLAG
ncbi:MAG: hypothetical protein A2W09_07045 [Deltaproteobacteria bacterium RBG_16_50_11]|nr:MAG: hypothetical protein A2W09_07045 [Deltaproteobacteria bacterium RBG_16_50_11]